MPFVAGQKLRASELNDAVPIYSVVSADITVTSSTTLVNATGLALALAADGLYAWDAYLAYSASETGDLKVAMLASATSSGHWGIYGGATSSSGAIGDLNAGRATAYGAGQALTAGGSNTPSAPGPMAAIPHGYLDVGATAGTLQLQFAQNTSTGTSTIVREGSWIRAWKIG
ncbi:MAG: hypothetical protein L0H84_04535 [Pseudonocardia sp.]|nr:hypothetical protein [Pseudonocardia sp.]